MAKSRRRKQTARRFTKLRKLLIEKEVVNSKPRKLNQRFVYETPGEIRSL
jgi:hypothetical protein